MDPFTQKLLERTRARKEYLDAKFAKLPQPTPRKRRSPLKEDNRKSNDILGSQEEDSPGKRQCTETVENTLSIEDSPEIVLPSKARERKNLHAPVSINDDEPFEDEARENHCKPSLRQKQQAIDEPVENYCKPSLRRQQQEADQLFRDTSGRAANKGCTNRLAALAANINMWEEETCSAIPASKSRPMVDSSSTPPNSSSGTTLSSSASFKTPSSESSSSEATSCADSLNPVSTPIPTPKLKINIEEFQKPKLPNSKTSPGKQQQTKTRNVVWDQAIVATLESQGFVKSPSKSKLQYKFQREEAEIQIRSKLNKQDSSIEYEVKASDSTPTSTDKPSSSEVSETKRSSVKELAKKFASEPVNLKGGSYKDPAELSLADRVALFEKEAAEASATRTTSVTSISRPHSLISPVTNNEKPTTHAGSAPVNRSPVKTKSMSPSVVKSNAPVSPVSPAKVGQHTFELHRKLFEHNQDWKENDISAKIKKDRQKDMEVVMNRWSYKNTLNSAGNTASTAENTSKNRGVMKNTPPPPPPPPLPGKSFPTVTSKQPEDSGSETTESEASEEHDITNDWAESDHDLQEDSGSDVNEEDVERAVRVIDEIISSSGDEDSECGESKQEVGTFGAGPDTDFESSIIQEAFTKVKPLMTTETKNIGPQNIVGTRSIEKSEVTGHLYPPLHEIFEDKPEPQVPLLHTVSFYRRQKESVRLTPVRTVVHHQEESSLTPVVQSQPQSSPTSPQMSDQSYSIQDKIKDLQDEVKAQQIIMGQASQALNLCRSSEFHGSPEEIEGERLLLIAAQRRLACLNEIQRLKVLGANGDQNRVLESTSKGSLSISDLKLPLKIEFLESTNMGTSGEFVHFFLCLVKHRSQVIATQMVSTKDRIVNGAFSFPNLINIRDLDQDFNIVIELYSLKTKRDNIRQQQKSLACRREKSKLGLTPKKRQSKKDLRMTSPVVQSPGGPGAVCTSNFSLSGFTTVNIMTLQKSSWILEECPKESPLDGHLFMKLQCYTDFNVEGEGFLTMFEDVGGFGAWHRRWFRLSKRYIRYWKYPDDVKRKDPIGTIDLCKCVTSEVGLVPRDICARPHTLMIVTVRPPSPDGESTLVSQSHSSYTSVKILLSADTKEERLTWCHNLNKALGNVRAWEPEALRPMPCGPHA